MALGRKPIEIVNDGKHQLLVKSDKWDRIYLGKIATVQNGYAFKSSAFVKNGGMPLIRIRDIDKETTVDRYSGDYSKEFVVRKGDILVGMDGDFKVAIWKGENALLNQRVCRIIPQSKDIDPKFLFLCLQPYLDAINEETSSVTVKHLSSRTIEEIPLPFPIIAEQREIVSKIEELFSELDKGIEYLRLTQQQLKTYRQAVLNTLVTGSHLQPIESVINSLDQGWSPKCENEASTNKTEWAVIKTSAVQQGCFIEKENKRLPKNLKPREQHELFEGDILITRAGPRVRVGVCCMVKHIRPRLINSDKVYRIKVNTNIVIPEFFEFILNSPFYQDEIEKMKSGISDSGLNLTQKAFLQIKIPIPKVEIQHKVVEEIEYRLSVADKIGENIILSLKQAESLKTSILKRAFEGRLNY